MTERTDGRKHYPGQRTPYATFGGSVYGQPYEDTMTAITREIRRGGRILSIAAGDLRHEVPIVRAGYEVVAGEWDIRARTIARRKATIENTRSAAGVLLDTTEPLREAPRRLRERPRLQVVKLNAFGEFPFPDDSFDGVISNAFLYYFPEEVIQHVVNESARVLKSKGEGVIIFDLLTDRQVTRYDGTQETSESPVAYSQAEGKELAGRVLEGGFREPTIIFSEVDVDRLRLGHRLQASKLAVVAQTK